MKKQLTLLIYSVATLLSLLMTQQATAQASQTAERAGSGMTTEQAKAVKAVKIANLDKDTYLKINGFILDRYEERPAYVFTYTDGITRKIYLYKVFDAATTKELGLAAFYVNGKTSEVKTFVIPGADGDRKAWDAYIDDLKYVGEKEPGLMSTLTFVLSREMASLLSGGVGKPDDGSPKKEEYNFCFAADAPVTMADGSVKVISEIRVGDVVKSYDATTKTIISSPVIRIDAHRSPDSPGNFALTGVWLVPVQTLTAGVGSLTVPMLLEATANHPVLTTLGMDSPGRKALGDVKPGETLWHYEAGLNVVVAYRVGRVEKNFRTVRAVYNLVTQKGNYLVSDTVVLDK